MQSNRRQSCCVYFFTQRLLPLLNVEQKSLALTDRTVNLRGTTVFPLGDQPTFNREDTYEQTRTALELSSFCIN
jgi:hypothetical protein